MVLKRVEVTEIQDNDNVDTHVLARGINQYIFRKVPDNSKLVDVEVLIPDDNHHLRFNTPVKEGRTLYKFLLSRGYHPW